MRCFVGGAGEPTHITTPKNLSLIHMVSKKCLSVDQMRPGGVAAGLSGISLVMANSVNCHDS